MHCVFCTSRICQHCVYQIREDTSFVCEYRNCVFCEVGYDVDQETEKITLIIFISAN